MRLFNRTVNQRGDTIVEVLIAVAVMSSVLAGAFTVSQKSVIAVRDSQERGEMLQTLQGQVEQVRSIAMQSTSVTDPIFASPDFCIDKTVPTPTRVNQPVTFDINDLSSYSAGCTDINTRYNVNVKYDSATSTFVFTGKWDGLNGLQKQSKLSYRISPGVLTVILPVPGPTPGPGDAAISGPASSWTGDPSLSCLDAFPYPSPVCYTGYAINNTTDVSGLASCSWIWNLATGLKTDYAGSAPECQPNYEVSRYYDPAPGPYDYTNTRSYTIMLENRFTNGTTVQSNQRVITLPYLVP